jgi:T3SS negative regulator,GrlR
MLQNGSYKVEFQTPLGAGSGVVFHQNGEVHGGDATMLYIGTMAEKDGEIVAEIEATTHTRVPGVTSVFGLDHVNIKLVGNSQGDSGATLTGRAKEAPGVDFRARLSLIRKLS